ncbi:MAG TPA: hypothetical protein DCE80_21150 [Ignavibacteriales bacterium]|nr:hypothetical protein [Ignavibacteriales bacterium]
MIAEISSFISSAKTAYDIAKGISTLKSDVGRNESISKILEILLSVQTQALSVNEIAQKLQEEKYEITQKLMKFEKWSETETQYELKEIASGVFVYACKKTNPPSEPMHWLCTNCWKDRMKSIIQKTLSDSYACPKCKTIYPFLDRGGDVSSIQDYNPFQYI